MKKLTTVLVACIIAVTGSLNAPVSQAQESLFIQQGDEIITRKHNGDNASCTVGYVDKGNRTLMFTGHCAAGETGNLVMDSNWNPIGHVVENHDDRRTPHNDVAIVAIGDNVSIGENIYSGNRWAAPHELRPGDKVCSRGAKSNAVHCGYMTGWSLPNVVNATRSAGGTFGDSGGPAWVPGKGFIGMFTRVPDDASVWVYPDMNYGRISPESVKRDIQNSVNSAIGDFGIPVPPVRL